MAHLHCLLNPVHTILQLKWSFSNTSMVMSLFFWVKFSKGSPLSPRYNLKFKCYPRHLCFQSFPSFLPAFSLSLSLTLKLEPQSSWIVDTCSSLSMLLSHRPLNIYTCCFLRGPLLLLCPWLVSLHPSGITPQRSSPSWAEQSLHSVLHDAFCPFTSVSSPRWWNSMKQGLCSGPLFKKCLTPKCP